MFGCGTFLKFRERSSSLYSAKTATQALRIDENKTEEYLIQMILDGLSSAVLQDFFDLIPACVFFFRCHPWQNGSSQRTFGFILWRRW